MQKTALTENMCISNTPDTQVQEDHLLHNHHCHDEKDLGRTMMHIFDLSKSETHDKPTSSSNSVVNQQQQREQQQVGQSSSSSPTTIAEPSEVSSISSTTKPHRTIPAFILRKQAKMHVPTMIVVRMNDAAQQVDLGISTNDVQLLSDDSNDTTTAAAAAATTTTTTTTMISDAISTFSSWVQPASETVSNNDDTSTSSSSNAVLSTFSSWVRTDSPNDTC